MKAMMTAACLATVCALAANAQTQGQGQQQGQTQQTAPQQRADAQQAVTLSGCLERDTMAAATTGTTGQQPTTAQAFKLTDVTILSGAEHIRRTGTAGQTQQQQQQQQKQREAEDKDKEFRLTASAGVNLTEHVGHEVEVVGRVVTSSPSVAATGATGTTGTTGQTQQQQQQQQQQRTTQREEDRDKAPLIMVNTVKMTATTCR
jgi:hypothetical protein